MNEQIAENMEHAEAEVAEVEYRNGYFAPAELERGSEALTHALAIAEDKQIPVAVNFDMEQEFPEGYGLAIRWVRARGKETPIGLVVAAIPTLDAVMQEANGRKFVEDAIASELAERVVSAVRPRGESAEFGGTMPFSVAEFLAAGRRESGKATFNKIAGHFVKALKKKGIPFMSKGLLEQVLQSSAFAAQQFPYSQEAWIKVLDAMIDYAKKEGLDPSILEHWKATRDQVEVEVPELDFSDLA